MEEQHRYSGNFRSCREIETLFFPKIHIQQKEGKGMKTIYLRNKEYGRIGKTE